MSQASSGFTSITTRSSHQTPRMTRDVASSDRRRLGGGRRNRGGVAFYGHFNASNFGNESTLKAVLYNFRRFCPTAKVLCVSTGRPEDDSLRYGLEVVPIQRSVATSWLPRHPVLRKLCRFAMEIPGEPFRLMSMFATLRKVDMFVVPGTGLLNDAYGLLNWGPLNLFKWVLMAKVSGCRVAFVSVGAGPIYRRLGRWLVRAALALADNRSYRDLSSKRYLESIGFCRDRDPVLPDLAFSLPPIPARTEAVEGAARPVVGLGVMVSASRYGNDGRSDALFDGYMDSLVDFVRRVVGKGYSVRLLSGDVGDVHARTAFGSMLRDRLPAGSRKFVLDEPVSSVADVFAQIAATDFVVATRFHNIVFALIHEKPVISVSFHHKCDSLMDGMGLSGYRLGMNELEADRLADLFASLEANADEVRDTIKAKLGLYRAALDGEYALLFDRQRSERPGGTA
jgi:polysaccharide pyruvyl transferase WcaK-like protein